MQYQCPNCKGYKVTSDKAALIGLGAFFILGGFLLSFLVLPLIFVPLGLLVVLAAAFTKPKQLSCRNCHFKWRLMPQP